MYEYKVVVLWNNVPWIWHRCYLPELSATMVTYVNLNKTRCVDALSWKNPPPRISKQFMAADVWKLFTLLQVTLIKLLVQPGRFGRNDFLCLPWDSIWQFQILWHKKCKLQWNTTIKLYKTYNFWIQIFKERERGKNIKTPDKKFNRSENFEFLMQALQRMHVLIFFSKQSTQRTSM